MALNVKSVIFLLCTYFLISFTIAVVDEEELERQLKTLNKPSTKSYMTEDGNIFDCVAITNQPALDHPSLKDHKIQMKPSSFDLKKESSFDSGILFGAMEECPIGTVPIQRTLKEHLIRARSLLDDPNPSRHATVSLYKKPSFKMFGGGGNISIQSLDVSSDQSSSSSFVIRSGPSDLFNLIEAGWMVSPELFGDSRTRLFTYWIGGGNQKTGCYNTLCSGFVQVDRRIAPGILVTPLSIYGGVQFVFEVTIYQDKKTGNWWLMVGGSNNVAVGYWPKNLFSYLQEGTTEIVWRGYSIAGKTGISPPMGNGHLPNGDVLYSAYFSNIYYVDDKNTIIRLSNTDNGNLFQKIDKPKCYGLVPTLSKYINLGYSFTFGGPGGNCG